MLRYYVLRSDAWKEESPPFHTRNEKPCMVPIRSHSCDLFFYHFDRESGQKRLVFPSRKEGFLFRLEFFIEQINKGKESY